MTEQPPQGRFVRMPTHRTMSRGTWSIAIGQVAGVEVRVHASFALILLLLLAAGAEAGGIARNLVWLVTIFACVLVHELAHSVVARRRGATVHGILLLPIGGISQLEDVPEAPRDEFAIAVVGPLASCLLAAAAAAVAVALEVRLLPIDLLEGPFLHRLVWLNLAIGAFNLLPAFPLDGGRVLRAALERRHDRVRATELAARVGRFLGVAMVAVGFVVDLWLLLIGLFVIFGATTEEAVTFTHARLSGVLVGDLMLLDPVVVEGHAIATGLQPLLRHTSQQTFPVVDRDGRYVGTTTADALASAGPAARVIGLTDLETRALAPTDMVEDALAVMAAERSAALPVLSGGRVVGLLRGSDVTRLVRSRAARVTTTT